MGARASRILRCFASGCALLAAVWMLTPVPALAGGPRFVSPSGIWVQPAQPEGWGVSQLAYFTDPGDLSASVTHAQADAMVAAAAAVWNVPTSSLSLSQGGQLAEHVSSANTSFDGSAFVFPPDVEVSNEGNVPVPVIYDTDGSVTDLLLGAGASDPVGCRHSAVTESVDDIQLDGHIHHAMLVLNGRCVSGAPEQLIQMQYQLARAFGRVLGLAWSQNNDNVFTAATTVTSDQESYWPLMHPLDVICGSYTYQCMVDPFTLRPDDLSALDVLYPVTPGNQTGGKQLSGNDALFLYGALQFPTGQGMDWVNVTTHRQNAGVTESWQLVSAITGTGYQQALANPVTQAQPENEGAPWPDHEGAFAMPAVPLNGLSNVFVATEPINPLYSGEYALGPYSRPPVTPSGSPQATVAWSALGGSFGAYMTAYDAAASCAPGNDGTESAPAALDPSGWQAGLICGWGHSSWWSATVRAGRSWTMEVTATDETGAAATAKLQPVLGAWNAADPTGTLPTLGSAPVPFNSLAAGVTQWRAGVASADTAFRFVVSDQYGAGRPDFTYTTRLLYADAVSPATIGSGGGLITVSGQGFRRGNLVRVNGAVATVRSWTATQIVAVAPSAAAVGSLPGNPVAVTVADTGTGGTTTILQGFSYTAAPDLLEEVSAPSALRSGVVAAVPFVVRVLADDGITPLPGATVRFAVTAGAASLGLCQAGSCSALSDANGLVATTLTGGAAGPVTVSATEVSGGATLQLNLEVTVAALAAVPTAGTRYVAAGMPLGLSLVLNATADGAPGVGVPVTWAADPPLAVGAASGTTLGDGTATATIGAAGLAPGSVSTVTGCVWSTVCATWTIHAVDSAEWTMGVGAGGGQSVVQGTGLLPVTLLVTDLAGHRLEGAPVAVYQRVLGWEGVCPAGLRCPAAPVLESAQTSTASDVAGTISVSPLQIASLPQTVQIAAATGAQGFATVTLVIRPAGP